MTRTLGSPSSLADALQERTEAVANGQLRTDHVVERLISKFGTGQQPKLRQALYERLSREAELNGEPVLRIISECVLASESATYKDRYFCAAVTRRLREAGFFKGGQTVQW